MMAIMFVLFEFFVAAESAARPPWRKPEHIRLQLITNPSVDGNEAVPIESNFTTENDDRPLRMRTHFSGAEQILEDKLFNYNKNVRPCEQPEERTTVNFSASLIRIIDLDEKAQRLITNLWLKMQWRDSRLKWDPIKYGGVYKVNIPADFLWKPDIVLYKNADGPPDVTIMVDTVVYFDGTVVWQPPAIFQSLCPIDVKSFPYDTQECVMKFGDWSYSDAYVEVLQDPMGRRIEDDEYDQPVYYKEEGMDMSYYVRSAEWDILNLTSKRNRIVYSTCCGIYYYPDVTFHFILRRKPEFYTAFLVAPSLLIGALTTFVSYLPSCSMKKMTFAISILMSLMVFYTAVVDLLPPNSVTTPLLMKYMLFTNLLVCLSIGVNVIALNLHYRTVNTHKMSKWMRWFFLKAAPKVLFMKVPEWHQIDPRVAEIKKKIRYSVAYSARLCGSFERRPSPFFSHAMRRHGQLTSMAKKLGMHPTVVKDMISNINGIAESFSIIEDADQVREDWGYVALVLDRITFWLFLLANVIGNVLILMEAVGAFFGPPELPIPPAKYPLGFDQYLWELFNNTDMPEPEWLWNHSYDNCFTEKCRNNIINSAVQFSGSNFSCVLFVMLSAAVSVMLRQLRQM